MGLIKKMGTQQKAVTGASGVTETVMQGASKKKRKVKENPDNYTFMERARRGLNKTDSFI